MLSHHHKCLFVHVPKTAGQSVEDVFLQLLDLNRATRAPLLLRPNDRPELGPPRLGHLKALDYVRCKYVTEEQFGSYFKFAFVRNPWARVVSLYRHFGFVERMDFKSFLMKTFIDDLWSSDYWFVGPQYEFVCNPHGEIVVDFLGRFENLQADFDRVCRRIGIPLRRLPHVNSSVKKEERRFGRQFSLGRPRAAARRLASRLRGAPAVLFGSYEDHYDGESVQFVANLYRKDIDLFGYRFGGQLRSAQASAAKQ